MQRSSTPVSVRRLLFPPSFFPCLTFVEEARTLLNVPQPVSWCSSNSFLPLQSAMGHAPFISSSSNHHATQYYQRVIQYNITRGLYNITQYYQRVIQYNINWGPKWASFYMLFGLYAPKLASSKFYIIWIYESVYRSKIWSLPIWGRVLNLLWRAGHFLPQTLIPNHPLHQSGIFLMVKNPYRYTFDPTKL
jgi:hypothetical protein